MPIFDQGYQHWHGPLTSYGWRWWAIARHGVRATLKGKIIKVMLLGAWMPAIALVIVLACWGLLEQQAETIMNLVRQMVPKEILDNILAKPQDYRPAVWTIAFYYFFQTELLWAVFLILAVGPSLISKDLRFNALPLYFSRPIRRFDYFVGKLGVIAFFIAATTIIPAIVAYLAGLAFSLDFTVIRDTHHLLWGSFLYGLVITISAGTLMLAMSSLSRRSIYVGITWAGFCLLTLAVSGILIGIQINTYRQELVTTTMTKWVADHPPPEGVEMIGHVPIWQGRARIITRDMTEPERAIEKWRLDWRDANRRAFRAASESAGMEAMVKSNWRPAVAYTNNLSRVGDKLLDIESAWLAIGRLIEKPRAAAAAAAPMIALKTRSSIPTELLQSGNERRLAEQMVPQYPWQWSAGVLLGLWLLSVMILSFRVKSLDRLK